MTKHIRIENADTSNHVVKVYTENLDNLTGEWIRNQKAQILDYPTAMTTLVVFKGQRLVVEELND